MLKILPNTLDRGPRDLLLGILEKGLPDPHLLLPPSHLRNRRPGVVSGFLEILL